MRYEDFHRRSIEQPEAFWAEAATAIDWNTPVQRLLPDFRLAYPDPADNARLRRFFPDIEAVLLRDGLAATVDWYRTLPDYRR